MSTSYLWSVDQLYAIPEPMPLEYFVTTVVYTVTATDGQYSATYQGRQNYTYIPEAQHLPYSQLTSNIVIGWVQYSLGVDGVAGIQATLDGQINYQANPPVSPEAVACPWESQQGENS